MRLITAAASTCVVALGLGISLAAGPDQTDQPATSSSNSARARGNGHHDGRDIFRFDTFGDEQLWTNVLRMHEVLPNVDPQTALAVGLKVDAAALPREVIDALRAGTFDLTNPAVTIALLRLNAVVGVQGTVTDDGRLTKVGITCALCHSSVDNSVVPGVGQRLDGWGNVDLDVGKIVALSPAPELDDKTKDEFRMWGPGKYDPRHHAFDGTRLIPLNSPSLPIVIPPIYGLRGVGFETVTADGPISYWNSYVGVGQMGGHGSFNDPRIGLAIAQTPDLVTPKLAALLDYQLSLHAPQPSHDSFDHRAAARGKQLFRNEAGCSRCHEGPHLTDVLSGADPAIPLLHTPAETGMDPRYADRTATHEYRTTPLRGLQFHAPYFHDGSAPDLPAVVDHYDTVLKLGLSDSQKRDLVEYLKSL